MSAQPNRLPVQADQRFEGAEIDRQRPLRFRLDGRSVSGFAGDTVLSAALASGIIGAGNRDGAPLALDERFAPPVLLRSAAGNRGAALPMARLPAIDGLDLVTLGSVGKRGYRRTIDAMRSAMVSGRRSLLIDHDDDRSLAGPWLEAASHEELNAELAIIGGGLAGMAAALAAAKRGTRVVLIERRQSLGGDARFFGGTGDEEAPEDTIARLATAIAAAANIRVLCRAEVFALFEGTVRVHQVEIEGNVPGGRVLTVSAARIVIATGAIERLPVFAGNRLPGVVGALAAFHRAERFGVWIGRRTVLSTANSFAYRLAAQAKGSGIVLERIVDSRLDPHSRFIEFSKAYGIPLARASRPLAVEPGPRHLGGLALRLDASFDGVERASTVLLAEQVLVAGGWQPNLSLWHMAGGSGAWQAASHRLEAKGSLPGIVLAGAAAGYRNAAACVRSGEAAVAQLFGRSVPNVDDAQIDPIHETPDDPTPIAPFDADAKGNSYLDGGNSLTMRPVLRRKGWRPWRRAGGERWDFAEQARPLSVADVAAAVQLGAIPADDAAIVVQERCVTPGDIADQPALPAASERLRVPVTVPPSYLAGRFGAKPAIRLIEALDGRAFEIGCLVYLNSDLADPLAAVGVVFGPAPEGQKGGLAVLAASAGDISQVVVRDISGPIAARLVDAAKAAPAVEAAAPVPQA